MGGNSGQKKKPRRLATRAAKPNTERVNQGQYVEIASEDDEMISQAILKWSGLKPEWDRYELSRLFNFGGAIAFECEHIEWETKEWSTAPGMGGNWYTVWTSNDDSLKAEMKVRLARLLKENKSLIRENLQEAKLIAAERARQIAGGPVTRLRVADDGVRTFEFETYEPDIRSVLGVPAEHWTRIKNGDPIEYKEVRSVYNGLYFTTSWLFNCDVRGSVSLCRPGEKPAFTGSLDDFIQSKPSALASERMVPMGDNSGRKVKSATPTKLLHEEPTVPERNLLQVTREMELDPQVVAKLGTDEWDPNDLTEIQRKKLDDYMDTLKRKLARLTNPR